MVQRRLGESENFVGARWNYIDFDARFDPAREQPLVLGSGQTIRSSGLGLFFEHDSRDNFFTASRGWKLFAESVFYSPELGSDEEYQTYRAQLLAYFPLGKEFDPRRPRRRARGARRRAVLPAAVHRDARHSVLPLPGRERGAGRGRAALERHAALGAGRIPRHRPRRRRPASAWGVGFRRLVARRLGIYMGVDIARGPEETAIYIQAGSAWR